MLPPALEKMDDLNLWQEEMVRAVRGLEVGQENFFKEIRASEKTRDEGYKQCKLVLETTAADSAEALNLSREAIRRVSGLEGTVTQGLSDLSKLFMKEMKATTDAIKASISMTIATEATVKKTWGVLGWFAEFWKRMAFPAAGFGVFMIGYHLVSQKIEMFFNWLFHIRW